MLRQTQLNSTQNIIIPEREGDPRLAPRLTTKLQQLDTRLLEPKTPLHHTLIGEHFIITLSCRLEYYGSSTSPKASDQ